MLPPKENASFVAAMEDVLEVYTRPYDPARPVACFDDATKQLVAEVQSPLPAQPGQPARVDYEYERRGTANLFMVFEPLAGQRRVKVTDRDNQTGLMPGKEMTDSHLIFYVESAVTGWANRENTDWGTESLAGGYDDWRPATMTEILQAKEAGLFDHPDFDCSYHSYSLDNGQTWDEIQSLNDPLPVNAQFRDGHGNLVAENYTHPNYHNPCEYWDFKPDGELDQWGEICHITGCVYMEGTRIYRWAVRLADGSAILVTYSHGPIPVRGAPPSHDLCPHNHNGVPPDKPGGGNPNSHEPPPKK